MFKILITGTEENLCEQLQARLQEEGYQLECALTCDELLEKSRSMGPDLILMEPRFADEQSFSTCQNLKEDPDTEAIPIIFFNNSTETPNGEVIKGFHSGATDFINMSANVNMDEVIARIQSAIQVRLTLSKTNALANQLTQMNAELYERNTQIEKELYVTRQLQQSLLPPFIDEGGDDPSNQVEGKTTEHTDVTKFSKCHFLDDKIRVSGVYLPCDTLGGDIYDVIQFPNKTLGVSIADVSGHGVPAAFVTAIFKSSFYRATLNYNEPGDILFHLNNELINIIKTGQYITGIYCRIYQDGQKLQYSGAGHPYPISYNAADGSVTRLQENGTPLAWFKDMEYPMGELRLDPGDKMLIFTDGVSEMKRADGEIYTEDELVNLFHRLIQEDSKDILDQVIHALSEFAEGHPLEDDISLVLIEAL